MQRAVFYFVRAQLRVILLAAALFGAAGASVFAGPVPGVETIEKKAVEFPVPPSIEAWDIGSDQYLVTFHWKPAERVMAPAVAGDFNAWSRADLPMNGPDTNGDYTVTAKLKAGDYKYKFIAGMSEWFSDPLNTEKESDAHSNSILHLGVTAIAGGIKAERGDGKIEMRGFQHDPSQWFYAERLAEDSVAVRCRTLRNDVEGVYFEFLRDEDEQYTQMQLVGSDAMFDYYETILALHKDGLYYYVQKSADYCFQLRDGSESTDSEPAFHFARLKESKPPIKTPDWTKDAIWYQIMVDRFRDGDPSNNPEQTEGTDRVLHTHPWRSEWYTEQPYEREGGKSFWHWSAYERLYGGDFKGVEDELDYLQKLGVNAIYLNPVFESTISHKYNARSYNHADDGYGTPNQFEAASAKENLKDPATWVWDESDKKLLRLIGEVHKRKMHIILDGVFNHLGNQAVPFLDVKKNGRNSPYADWFDVTSWDPFTYNGWAGTQDLPAFKKDPVKGYADDSVRDYVFNITKRWMDLNGDGDPSDGIDGWRLDVPQDVPSPFWVAWRKVVKGINPDAYIVGEIWSPAESWLAGDQFDAVMNYQFSTSAFKYFGNVEKKISVSEFDNELARLRLRYPREATYALQNLYDSHDTDRWVSRLANPDKSYDGDNRIQDKGVVYNDKRPGPAHYQRMRLMALFQATYVGAPMIWYGTEAGMFGADDPMDRMPMWWKDMQPYDSPDYFVDGDLKNYFSKLFAMRTKEKALRRGEFATLLADDGKDVFAYSRFEPGAKDAIVVVLNNSSQTQDVEIPKSSNLSSVKNPKVIFGKVGKVGEKNETLKISGIPPVSGVVIRVR
ncbi:hypothetical protein BH09SUM1_BH09SUM1_08910 [soil metagenome]